MKNLMFLELLEYWHRSMGGLGVTDQSNRWSRQGAWLSLGLTASLLGLIGPGAAIATEQAEQELSNAIASEQAQSTALASEQAEQNDDSLLELPTPLEPSASLEKSPVASAMETEAVAEPAVSSETEEFFQQLSQSSESDPLFIEPVEPEAVDAPDFMMDSSDEEDRWIKRDQLGTPSIADPDSDFVGGTSFEERQDLGRPPAWSDYDGEVEVEPLTNTAATTASDAIPAIEFLQVERTPADGRTTALIQGQVVDGDGNPYTDDVLVTLTAAAGRFMGEDADEDRAGFQVVARDGEFQARLQSPLTAQWVRVRAAIDPQWDLELDAEDRPRETDNLPLPNTPYKPLASLEAVEAYTSVEFITNLRPSLVSGSLNLRIGKGNTNFYGPFEEFLDDDDDYGVDVDGGLFAIGTLGEWLFTGAVNLDRGLNDDCDGSGGLFSQSSTCDNRYPVYGDSSEINNLTPSKDSVFARLERTSIIPGAEPDFIMWGDWLTNEFSRPSQLFSATTRTLHGAKANYNFGGLQVTAAYANDIDGYRRDTIVPNGTSGLYFLSKRLVVAGSETVFVETEEINRPGFVVERKALQRGRDYDIDYDRGSIIFRRPILSTEFDPFGDTLVRKVVTTYEFEDDGDNSNGLLAGRLQYNFSRELGQESWIGASYLNEDKDDQDFSLFGLDFLMPLGNDGRLIAEYARSNNGVEFLGDVDGAAYRLEAEGKPTDWLRARAFYRTAEDGFANDSTSSFVPGQTRYGLQGTAQAGESTLFRFDVEQENNFGDSVILRPRFFDLFDPNPVVGTGASVDNSIFTARAGVTQQLGSADVGVDFVHRNRDDGKDTSLSSTSNQLVSRLRVPLGEKFAFRALNEINLTEDGDELYPNRTTLGVEWDTFPGVKLRLAHQFFGGGIIDNSAITSLDTIVEKALSDDTTLTSRYSVAGTQGGFSNYGSIGLNHRWTVSPGLKINLGYERIFDDLFDRTGAGIRQTTAYTQGQTAAVLGLSEGSSYSIGADYTGNDRFKANGRLEYRDTEDGDLFLASAAGVGKINDRLSILGRIESAGASNQTFIDRLSDTLDLDLGLAYRDPLNDRWNGLLRLEHRVNGDITPDSIGTGAESRATLVSAEGIYAPNWRWEFYGKYAMRWTETSLNGGFSNDSRVSLAQARALYRFDYRWDVAGEARWLNQPTADFSEWGWAGELGYYLNPDLRAYLGYSFGSADDRDFGGYRSDGGLYGGVNFKVNRLFNDFGVQMPVAKPDNDDVQAFDASASQEPLFDSVDSDPFADDIAPAAESVAPEFQEALPAEDSAQEIPRALF